MATEPRLLALLVVCALSSLAAAMPPSAYERGRQLFTGERTLSARMVGHTQELPQQAIRCTNCHQHERAASEPEAQELGPRLGPAWLTHAMARRGGPPSRYDALKLCRLLREGIDPAYVMIPQTMPRYNLSDTECEDLWTYLSAE